jgi:hypothetical protein
MVVITTGTGSPWCNRHIVVFDWVHTGIYFIVLSDLWFDKGSSPVVSPSCVRGELLTGLRTAQVSDKTDWDTNEEAVTIKVQYRTQLGQAVAQLAEALWYHVTGIFHLHNPWTRTMALRNRNEYQGCIRNDQQYALICTTPLFYTLANTWIGSSLPTSGSFVDPSEVLKYKSNGWYII